jgi:hypothetical protein
MFFSCFDGDDFVRAALVRFPGHISFAATALVFGATERNHLQVCSAEMQMK